MDFEYSMSSGEGFISFRINLEFIKNSFVFMILYFKPVLICVQIY